MKVKVVKMHTRKMHTRVKDIQIYYFLTEKLISSVNNGKGNEILKNVGKFMPFRIVVFFNCEVIHNYIVSLDKRPNRGRYHMICLLWAVLH